MSMNIIETKMLTKYYGKARGIIDINMNVKAGDFYGFVGPNGAGKSTTIRTLLGLINPSGGGASVLGLDCRKDRNQILRRVGYMPSESRFYEQLRVQEIIDLSAKLHNKDCRLEAERLCERFSIDKKKRIEELSLGNRKKVSIVCAMQHKPELLILDEATSGLDPLMQKEFFLLLHELQKEGATILMSSHFLPEIQNNCSRVGIVKEGRLIAENNIEVFSQKTIKNIQLNGVEKLPKISGISNVITEDDGIQFVFQGDLKQLLLALGQTDLTDIRITEPSLEDIILNLYEKEESI